MENMQEKWISAQGFEKAWWFDCCNTLGEDLKQLEYLKHMGLETYWNGGRLFIKSNGKSITDIGAGPSSMLLRLDFDGTRVTIDPLHYPQWVYDRYKMAGINAKIQKGEDVENIETDEVWIYNCLQHVEDWRKILETVKKSKKVLRIFEWVQVETNIGHIHKLRDWQLDEVLGQKGKTELLDKNGCKGLCYFNVVDFSK